MGRPKVVIVAFSCFDSTCRPCGDASHMCLQWTTRMLVLSLTLSPVGCIGRPSRQMAKPEPRPGDRPLEERFADLLEVASRERDLGAIRQVSVASDEDAVTVRPPEAPPAAPNALDATVVGPQRDPLAGLLATAEPIPTAESMGLTLNAAVAASLRFDPVLAAGFQEIAVANAEYVTSSLKPNPELEIIQSLLPLTRPFEADIREGGPPQFDVMLGYPIDWYLFGKRAAAMRSTAAEVHVSRAEYADLIRERVLETAVAYYDVMELQALVELAKQDVDNLRTVEDVTVVAVDNGALPRVELNRIRLDRLNSEQTLRETERDLRTAKAELRALMGGFVPGVAPGEIPVEVDFTVDDELSIEPRPEAAAEALRDLDQALVVAEANRPDIRALRMRISQSRLEMESQRREAYPEVAPMFGYTRQFQRRAIGQPDADSWGAGIAMTLPFHDRNQGNRLLATAQWRQNTQLLRSGLVDLRAEVVAAAADLETARINAAAVAEEQLRLAEQVRDSIRQAYEAGGRPLIDVLDSQRNFRETFENYITSRADYLRAVQRFNATLGS